MVSHSDKDYEAFYKQVEKNYGQGSIFTPKFKPLPIDWIQTPVHAINSAFGNGIPRGRIIEIYGPEASGKTTLTLELVKAVQHANEKAFFIDTEHALDPEYAKGIGVSIDDMPISQPDSGEKALDMLYDAVVSGLFGIIVVDSVDGCVPQSRLDGNAGDANMASLAKLMSDCCRKIKGECNKTKTTVLFTNQIRNKIGVFWGSPFFTSGGNALKFYASIRGEIKKVETLEEDKRFVGIKSKLKIVKNKVAPPFKEVMLSILFGKGIDKGGDLRAHLMEEGRLECRGSNYYLDGDVRIGAGKAEADKWLATEFAIYEKQNKGKKKK